MKIDFHYSTIYDDMLTEMCKKEQDISQIREVRSLTDKFQTYWKKREKTIISLIEKHSKLKFNKNITVYFVRHMRFTAISIPLTIKYIKNLKEIEKILIHELIHNILTQNGHKVLKLLSKTYPEEDWDFRIHIPVLLIQKKVFEKLYDKKTITNFFNKEENIFGPEFIEINRIYPQYKNDILKFLKNEDLE